MSSRSCAREHASAPHAALQRSPGAADALATRACSPSAGAQARRRQSAGRRGCLTHPRSPCTAVCTPCWCQRRAASGAPTPRTCVSARCSTRPPTRKQARPRHKPLLAAYLLRLLPRVLILRVVERLAHRLQLLQHVRLHGAAGSTTDVGRVTLLRRDGAGSGVPRQQPRPDATPRRLSRGATPVRVRQRTRRRGEQRRQLPLCTLTARTTLRPGAAAASCGTCSGAQPHTARRSAARACCPEDARRRVRRLQGRRVLCQLGGA